MRTIAQPGNPPCPGTLVGRLTVAVVDVAKPLDVDKYVSFPNIELSKSPTKPNTIPVALFGIVYPAGTPSTREV